MPQEKIIYLIKLDRGSFTMEKSDLLEAAKRF